MTDAVTSAQTKVRVEIPGTDRTYDLRPPTFGEVGDMAGRAEGALVPSDAIFVDVVRDTIMASDMPQADKDRHCTALDAWFEADDSLRSIYATLPDVKDWTAEHRAQVADADRILRAATRARNRAEWAVREVPAVRDALRQKGTATRTEATEIVALCLGMAAAEVLKLPAGDFTILQNRAMALIRPTQAAEKN